MYSGNFAADERNEAKKRKELHLYTTKHAFNKAFSDVLVYRHKTTLILSLQIQEKRFDVDSTKFINLRDKTKKKVIEELFISSCGSTSFFLHCTHVYEMCIPE